mmetsp:Transcript_13479/g.17029  ORF Transcript_13479/g.17029 Transcript_13479/m.17029 type:complete len:164 (-) Transcript_13479:172-663(-)|eukprot:CAMPEP_0203665684 /NCGR_PEP_ID=MMETSP0090-20130426/2859_1 /ASSEMBLY_ACC=CAM_ASM_001088 /TAXON_ID=426623 /ORGANISM="Chaetoceros affinis, Strain CCMP159" /LENGTH=163 /DNA_ID=CAMNT_0050529325 /DNA_START=110 /DNA_END=601 /DNA_ORIENTATION=+
MATIQLVIEAILALQDRTGSSVIAINKWIESEKKSTIKKHVMKAALKSGVEKGLLVQVKNSYKVSADTKKAVKKKATAADKPKKTTKSTATKKKAPKKTSAPKKKASSSTSKKPVKKTVTKAKKTTAKKTATTTKKTATKAKKTTGDKKTKKATTTKTKKVKK